MDTLSAKQALADKLHLLGWQPLNATTQHHEYPDKILLRSLNEINQRRPSPPTPLTQSDLKQILSLLTRLHRSKSKQTQRKFRQSLFDKLSFSPQQSTASISLIDWLCVKNNSFHFLINDSQPEAPAATLYINGLPLIHIFPASQPLPDVLTLEQIQLCYCEDAAWYGLNDQTSPPVWYQWQEQTLSPDQRWHLLHGNHNDNPMLSPLDNLLVGLMQPSRLLAMLNYLCWTDQDKRLQLAPPSIVHSIRPLLQTLSNHKGDIALHIPDGLSVEPLLVIWINALKHLTSVQQQAHLPLIFIFSEQHAFPLPQRLKPLRKLLRLNNIDYQPLIHPADFTQVAITESTAVVLTCETMLARRDQWDQQTAIRLSKRHILSDGELNEHARQHINSYFQLRQTNSVQYSGNQPDDNSVQLISQHLAVQDNLIRPWKTAPLVTEDQRLLSLFDDRNTKPSPHQMAILAALRHFSLFTSDIQPYGLLLFADNDANSIDFQDIIEDLQRHANNLIDQITIQPVAILDDKMRSALEEPSAERSATPQLFVGDIKQLPVTQHAQTSLIYLIAVERQTTIPATTLQLLYHQLSKPGTFVTPGFLLSNIELPAQTHNRPIRHNSMLNHAGNQIDNLRYFVLQTLDLRFRTSLSDSINQDIPQPAHHELNEQIQLLQQQARQWFSPEQPQKQHSATPPIHYDTQQEAIDSNLLSMYPGLKRSMTVALNWLFEPQHNSPFSAQLQPEKTNQVSEHLNPIRQTIKQIGTFTAQQKFNQIQMAQLRIQRTIACKAQQPFFQQQALQLVSETEQLLQSINASGSKQLHRWLALEQQLNANDIPGYPWILSGRTLATLIFDRCQQTRLAQLNEGLNADFWTNTAITLSRLWYAATDSARLLPELAFRRFAQQAQQHLSPPLHLTQSQQIIAAIRKICLTDVISPVSSISVSDENHT